MTINFIYNASSIKGEHAQLMGRRLQLLPSRRCIIPRLYWNLFVSTVGPHKINFIDAKFTIYQIYVLIPFLVSFSIFPEQSTPPKRVRRHVG